MTTFNHSLLWFRRDLRLSDHAALHHALSQSQHVHCAFIFDRDILDILPRADRRVEFIHASIAELDAALRGLGSGLHVRHAVVADEIPRLAHELQVDAVFANHDYEPAAIARDALVAQRLEAGGKRWFSFKDQVIFEKNEVLSLAGQPFSVFTPYKNAWLKKLYALLEQSSHQFLNPYAIEPYQSRLAQDARTLTPSIPTLQQLGFESTNLSALRILPGMSGAQTLLEDFLPRMASYDVTRDFPAIRGPSYLSVHLRFGTLSIRTLVRTAVEAIALGQGGSGTAVWLSELIWREFYFMILFQHPHVVHAAFKPDYDAIEWESGVEAQTLFQAWCDGRTGYPLVDAAMAQINQTGYMHNRLRMVTACFLIKDLGIDWRWGEGYFAQHLNDFDLSANNGGWQWASSSGCDAQPYFRIFNPVTQSEKFDAEGKFIRRYLPQLAKLPNKHIHAPWLLSPAELAYAGVRLGENYPHPIVAHEEARKQTLARYAVVKKAPAAA